MAEQTEKEMCSICLNEFQKPVILDCQHSFCFTCLEDYVNKTSLKDQFHCPLCRCIYVGKISVHRFKPKLNIDDNHACTIPQCDVCTEDTSQYFCQDCDQYLCKSCKTMHDKLKSCKDHVVFRYYGQQSRSNEIRKERTQVTNHQDFCSHHERKKVTMYCKDCSLAMCWKCFVANHNGHNYLDLHEDEVRKNIRQELTILNGELETHVTTLQKHYDKLSGKLIEVKNLTKTACDTVDAHVNKICSEFRKTGENIKKEMQKTSEQEECKLAKLMEEIKRLTEDFKASVKYSVNVLKYSSICQVIQRLPQVRQERDESCCRKLDIPNVRYSKFQEGEIETDPVTYIFGKVVSCHPNMIEDIFNVDTVEDCGWYCGDKQFLVSGFTWSIGIDADASSLCLRLFMEDVEDKSITSCKADFTFTVINKTDDRQSVVKQCNRDVGTGSYLVCYTDDVIDWTTLSNPDNGFIDDDRNFTVQVTINEVTDIGRRDESDYEYSD